MSLTPSPLIGIVDSANTVYTIPETYQPGTLELMADGKVLLETTDYVISGTDGETVTTTLPPDLWIAGTWVKSVGISLTNYLTVDQMMSRVGGPARWIELTDDDQDANADADVIQELFDGVDAEVNGYLRAGGYAFPMTTAQIDIIRSTLLDIANYRLKTRGDRQPTDDDRNLFKHSIGVMRDVAARRILLVEVAEEVGTAFGLDSEPPLMSRARLRVL